MGCWPGFDATGCANLTNLDAAFQHPQWDPDLEWSVPYMVTAAGIVYKRKLMPAADGVGRSVERPRCGAGSPCWTIPSM